MSVLHANAPLVVVARGRKHVRSVVPSDDEEALVGIMEAGRRDTGERTQKE